MSNLSKRSLLGWTAIGALVALAGCGKKEEPAPQAAAPASAPAAAAAPAGEPLSHGRARQRAAIGSRIARAPSSRGRPVPAMAPP